jgi:hypothetical protein
MSPMASSAQVAATKPEIPAQQRVTVDIALGQDSPSDVLALLQKLEAQNVKQVKQRTLNGIETIVAGVLLLKRLATLIVRVLPLWNCGVVVDARGSRILTEKNCDLPRGTVLVIHPDGRQSKADKPTEAEMESLVSDFAPKK